MINPKELMIGNLIDTIDGLHAEITSLTKDKMIEGRPTKLNVMYLMGCGFSEKTGSRKIWVHAATGIELKAIDSVTFVQVCGRKEIGIPLQYFHELQNRLFCVAGYDLVAASKKRKKRADAAGN